MLRHGTEREECFATRLPLSELLFNGIRDEGEFREVSIVETKPANKFPYPLDGVKIRTVGWEEEQLKLRFLFFAPLFMHAGMMILGVVRDNDDASAGTTRYL